MIGPPLRWNVPWSVGEHHVRAVLRAVDRAGTDAAGERDGEFEDYGDEDSEAAAGHVYRTHGSVRPPT